MDDKQIDELYDRLRIVSNLKKIPFIEPRLKIHLIPKGVSRERNKDGSVPDGWQEIINRHSHSPVRNWYNWHLHLCSGGVDTTSFGDGSLVCKRTSAALESPAFILNPGAEYSNEYGFLSAAGVDTNGIQIGSTNTAESINDYILSAPILHDSAPPTAGRMQYSAVLMTEGWVTNGTDYYYAERERVFNNASGGTLNVVESALTYRDAASDGMIHLMMRDVFAQIAVANGEGLAVSYELRVNFPDLRT